MLGTKNGPARSQRDFVSVPSVASKCFVPGTWLLQPVVCTYSSTRHVQMTGNWLNDSAKSIQRLTNPSKHFPPAATPTVEDDGAGQELTTSLATTWYLHVTPSVAPCRSPRQARGPTDPVVWPGPSTVWCLIVSSNLNHHPTSHLQSRHFLNALLRDPLEPPRPNPTHRGGLVSREHCPSMDSRQ